MIEEKTRPIRFGEALGASVNSSFVNLRTEIMKNGAISTKDKALIALACAVAIPCDSCVEFHKNVAVSAGATKEEMLEAAAIGGLVRLGFRICLCFDDFGGCKEVDFFNTCYLRHALFKRRACVQVW